MKSRISCFDRGIFASILKRTWPLWAAYLIAWFLPMPLVTLVERMQYAADAVAGAKFIPEYLSHVMSDSLLTGCAISGFIMALLAAASVFMFLYSAKNAGLMASLPVKREAVFCSAYAAGLVPVVCADLLIVVFNLLASIGADVSWGILVNCNLFWLVINLSEFIAFYGIAVIIAMISANAAAVPVLYLIFNFLIPGMETVVNGIICEFSYGVESLGNSLGFMSPFITMLHFKGAVPSANRYEFFASFHDWGQLIAYLAVGIVLSVIALFAFKKHRMESAGDVVAISWLRPVFKYGVAVCASLCFGMLLYLMLSDIISSLTVLVIGLIVGAFIGYFVSEMLIKKSLHVFRGHWTGFIVLCVLALIFSFGCVFDLFGVASRLPDADDIECVYTDAYEARFTAPEDIAECLRINRAIISNKADYLAFANEQAHFDYDSPEADGRRWVGFHYTLKNGREISRSYEIRDDENFAAYWKLISRPDIVIERFMPDEIELIPANVASASLTLVVPEDYDGEVMFELTPEQVCDYYDRALIPDIEAGKLVYNYTDPAPGRYTVASLWIEFQNEDDEFHWESVSIDIMNDCVSSIQWCKDNLDVALTQFGGT